MPNYKKAELKRVNDVVNDLEPDFPSKEKEAFNFILLINNELQNCCVNLNDVNLKRMDNIFKYLTHKMPYEKSIIAVKYFLRSKLFKDNMKVVMEFDSVTNYLSKYYKNIMYDTFKEKNNG